MATKSIIKNIEISDPAEAEKLVKALEEAKKICDGAHFCVEGCEACEDNESCDFRESEKGMERLTTEQIADMKEYFSRSKEVKTSSLAMKLSHDGLKLIDTIEAQQQEIDRLKELLADWKYNTKCDADHIAALTAERDELAGRLMKMDYLLRRTLPILEVTNDQKGLIDAINALLGGKDDEKE